MEDEAGQASEGASEETPVRVPPPVRLPRKGEHVPGTGKLATRGRVKEAVRTGDPISKVVTSYRPVLPRLIILPLVSLALNSVSGYSTNAGFR